jgi:hypothetical protein
VSFNPGAAIAAADLSRMRLPGSVGSERFMRARSEIQILSKWLNVHAHAPDPVCYDLIVPHGMRFSYVPTSSRCHGWYTVSRCRVDDPISQKLRVRGLDISFLRWLEGKEDRLPRLHAVNQLEGEDLAAAIRAAAWLRQLCFQRDIVVPSSMEDWDSTLEHDRFDVALE